MTEERELSTAEIRIRATERERLEVYATFDELGEPEVDRLLNGVEWVTDQSKRNLAQSWLREQAINRDQQVADAAETSAAAATSSAGSAKWSARWAFVASLIALLAVAWAVGGSTSN